MMKRILVLGLLFVPAVFMLGCVSGGGASNGAIRLLNAVADAPHMNLLLNGQARVSSLDFGAGSPWAAEGAAQYSVHIDEVLISGATPVTKPVDDRAVTLAVNDEVTLVVLGKAASDTEEVVKVPSRTQGVPFGKTRLQFVHAGVDAPALDIYVIAPDALVSASTPLVSPLSYKGFTAQQDVTSGNARIVLTEVGDPAAVRFDSGSISLPRETSLLIAVLPNPGAVTGDLSLMLTILNGTGSSRVLDKDARTEVRAVNAAPGSYSLDVFVNKTTVDGSTRQVCDAGTTEADTLLELCALPFEAITSYGAIAPGSYGIKVQKTADDAVAAQTISTSLTGSAHSSLVLTGLTADAATTTAQNLMTLQSARRIAGVAQVRIASASLAADTAVAGDPTTDRLEVFITAPAADLTGRTADFVNLYRGADTGYLSFLPGSYEVTLAKVDTAAASGTAPEVLFTHPLTLDAAGIYTLVITDSTGGVLPLQALSLDDPTP